MTKWRKGRSAVWFPDIKKRTDNNKSNSFLVAWRICIPPFAKCAKDGAPGRLRLRKKRTDNSKGNSFLVAWRICIPPFAKCAKDGAPGRLRLREKRTGNNEGNSFLVAWWI